MNLKKHLLTALLLSFTLASACSDPDTSPNSNNTNNSQQQDTSPQDTSSDVFEDTLEDTSEDTPLPEDTSEDILEDTDLPESPILAGILDDTFAPDSKTPGIFTGPDQLLSDGSTLTLDATGNIIVAGRGRLIPTDQPADFPKMFTLRVNTDGTPDPTFGNTPTIPGLTTLAFGPENQEIVVLATALQPDNKTVTCGNIRSTTMGRSQLVVARLNSDGTPDPTFGNTSEYPGLAYFDVPTDKPNSLCWALHILDDGKILAAGQVGTNSTMIPLLMRLNSDGTLDNTFGNDPETPGITLHDIAPDNIWLYAQLREFTVLPNGQILALIHSQNLRTGRQNGYLLRFNADGTLDEDFGLITLELPEDASHEAIDFTIHPTTGQIFITGRAFTTDPDIPFQAFVHALTADGQPDTQFPTFILTDLHAATRAILVQPDGKIVATGSSITHSNPAFEAGNLLAVRLLPDGQLDPTFATNGIFTHHSPTLLFYTARAQLDPQNRLVLTGSTPLDGHQSPRGLTFITRLR